MHAHSYKRELLLYIFKLIDILLIGFSFLIALVISSNAYTFSQLVPIINVRISVGNFILITFFLGFCHLLFNNYRFYDSHRLSSLFNEIIVLFKTTLICSIILIAFDYFFQMSIISVRFIIYFGLIVFSFFTISRLILRSVLKMVRLQGRNLRHVLIIGKNIRSVEYAKKISNNLHFGYLIRGFVDIHQHTDKRYNDSNSYVCDFDGFRDYVRKNIVDEIFLFLPIKSFYNELNNIISICEEQGIIVRMPTDLFKLKFAKAKVEQIGHDTLLTLYTGNMNRSLILVKELMDVILSLVLIIITSPVMLISAFMIKIFSPGPIFFLQNRVGIHKRTFKIIKFRTMYVNAEKRLEELSHLNETGSNGAFKIKNDPRITPIGKILRTLSIDELPQFFNVLKGDMSLIGPRPLTLRDYEGFSIDYQRRRFSVKPGLSCLWQIKGRSDTNFDEWMDLDMEYIDNWSLWLDFKIFFKTIFAVLKAEGAH